MKKIKTMWALWGQLDWVFSPRGDRRRGFRGDGSPRESRGGGQTPTRQLRRERLAVTGFFQAGGRGRGAGWKAARAKKFRFCGTHICSLRYTFHQLSCTFGSFRFWGGLGYFNVPWWWFSLYHRRIWPIWTFSRIFAWTRNYNIVNSF